MKLNMKFMNFSFYYFIYNPAENLRLNIKARITKTQLSFIGEGLR